MRLKFAVKAIFPQPGTMTVLSLMMVLAYLPALPALSADSQPVRLDGRFEDWDDRKPVSAPSHSTLIRSVRVTNGKDNIFLAVQLSREITIQKNNPLTLFADTDRDSLTGLRVGSLGADVQYKFGSLEAIRYVDGISTSVPHPEIGISWAPSFSSDRYEISLPLELFGQPVPDNVITLAVAELQDIQATATVVSHRTNRPDATLREISLEKLSTPHVRILSMNVLNDGLFKKPDTYERIFRALDPDIILLSEVFSHSSDQVVALLDERFPAQNPRQRWYGFGRPGKVTLSKFPFLATDIILEDLYTLIDVPGFDKGLFVVHTHLQCCDYDDMRQDKIDGILGNLRSSREDTYSILYKYQDMPLILSGDLNLVGESRQYTSLIEGVSADLSTALTTTAPASSKRLIEAISYHTNTPYTFTWKDDKLKWPPGKLDFTFVTVPDLILGKSFVLYTPDMDPETLRRYGLRESDSLDASDHLPHIIDIAPGKDAQKIR
ncbi:MAG: endonuclease/exonuclease/phosphatase family metal-dependent hydrolase [Candidatus Pelagisphaera sp.]|jgi:endonuclease/exonuclease/phosphatase family metal-dependent hydrolase